MFPYLLHWLFKKCSAWTKCYLGSCTCLLLSVYVIAFMILFAMHHEFNTAKKCGLFTVFVPLTHFFSLNKEMIAIKDSYFCLCTCFPERTVMVCTEWFFITFNCHIKEYFRKGLNKDDLMKEVSVLFKN